MKNKRPTKLTAFDLNFTRDPDCPTCPTGMCHGWATGNHDGKEYDVHVAVEATYCTPACASTIYVINVFENATTMEIEDLSRKLYNELEAVNYLYDTFRDFKCSSI